VLKYILRRTLTLVPMLLVVSILVFIALDLTPGDPVSYLLSPETLATVTVEQLDMMRENLGLNAPIYVRYYRWLINVLRGDFGYSLTYGTAISDMLSYRLPATLELSITALLLSGVLGILLGFVSAVRQNSALDYINTVLGILGVSIPAFFVGLLGIRIFAVELQWLPIGGRLVYGVDTFWGRLPNLIMPSLTLAIALLASLMRYTRSSMIDVLGMDYVKTARSKGLRESAVYLRHVFRNALAPVLHLLLSRIPMLIGGSIVIESTFGWAGMGEMLINGISSKDYPVIMMVVMATAVLVLVASLLSDICTAVLDPRVRLD